MLQKKTLELFHSWRISVCDAPRPFVALPFCAAPEAFVVPLFFAVSRPVSSALALFVPPLAFALFAPASLSFAFPSAAAAARQLYGAVVSVARHSGLARRFASARHQLHSALL